MTVEEQKIRVLGIDPGSRLTGFGVIDSEGDRLQYISSGAVKCGTGSIPERLRLIFASVSEIVAEFRPDVVSIESVFMHRNAGSALKLGHARSAAICATFELDVTVHEYAPREIKLSVVGNGSAEKRQVLHMVRQLLALPDDPGPDAADALAAAICHANRRRTRASLHAAARAAPRGQRLSR